VSEQSIQPSGTVRRKARCFDQTVSVTLRTPGPGDAAALAQLKVDTFLETYAANNHPGELAAHTARAFDPAAIAEQIADTRCITLWLLDEGRPVGYLKLNTGDAQTVEGLSDGLEVEQLYVRASHLGQGLGAVLLSRATEAARELGLSYVWLGVWEKNHKAIAFYEHTGFEPFDEHVFLFGDEEQRDLLMRLAL
jgi:diamine N-acetyltransferase